jgi:50S ribosomal subunit-associated GTPase HflX
VFVSAQSGAGLEALIERIDQVMPVDPTVQLSLVVPISDGRTLALLRSRGRILSSEVRDSQILIEAEVPESLARTLRPATAGSSE